MRQGSYPGMARMPHIVRAAPGDVRQRLWTLYWLTRLLSQKKAVVELGVRDGDSTRAILSGAEDQDDGTILWSYDIEDVSERVRQKGREAGGMPQATWAFFRTDSAEAGRVWAGGQVDMVFVDTDHTFETTRREIEAWHAHVRVGGVMAFHDYWLAEPPRDGVKPAVDQFFGTQPDSWTLETHDAAGEGDTGFALLWKRK